MIPLNQLNELFDHMFENVDSDIFGSGIVTYEITNLDVYCLNGKGFFDYFYKQAFKEKKIFQAGYQWGNRNKDLVIFYIKKFGLDKYIAYSLKSATEALYKPRHLVRELHSFFVSSEELKQKYEEFLNEINKEIHVLTSKLKNRNVI